MRKKMKVQVIGSGTYTFEGGRNTSCYLVETEKKRLLLDFGSGALQTLAKQGIYYNHIHHIFLTHFHPDHCSDLVSFIAITLSKYHENTKQEIHLYGPRGLKRLLKRIMKAFGIDPDKKKIKSFLNIHEFKKDGEVLVSGAKIKHFLVKHGSKKSFAYRIEEKNKILVYSGDTIDCPGIRFACEDADVAIMDSNNTPDAHLSPKEIADIVEESGVKNVVLSHINYKEFKLQIPLKEFERLSKKPVHLAYDGMKFIV
jgi:ribonuclease BN (tRNA processing enzyme)